MVNTAIDKILTKLRAGDQSTQELSEKLELPLGTVRSTLSTLRKLGFVEPVPKQKRGTPFQLTQKGWEKAEKLADSE